MLNINYKSIVLNIKKQFRYLWYAIKTLPKLILTRTIWKNSNQGIFEHSYIIQSDPKKKTEKVKTTVRFLTNE